MMLRLRFNGVLVGSSLLFALWACTTSDTTANKSIEEIEDEKDPLSDESCLEGEYFEASTDSCEPMEGQTKHDRSHDGAIDVPREGVFDEPEEEIDSALPAASEE